MTAAASSGVVTFLFTDVEGSTRRWEADADGMRAALAAHDEVLRKAIETHGGWLFKHTGDGVCAAFASPKCAATTGHMRATVPGLAARRSSHAHVARISSFHGMSGLITCWNSLVPHMATMAARISSGSRPSVRTGLAKPSSTTSAIVRVFLSHGRTPLNGLREFGSPPAQDLLVWTARVARPAAPRRHHHLDGPQRTDLHHATG